MVGRGKEHRTVQFHCHVGRWVPGIGSYERASTESVRKLRRAVLILSRSVPVSVTPLVPYLLYYLVHNDIQNVSLIGFVSEILSISADPLRPNPAKPCNFRQVNSRGRQGRGEPRCSIPLDTHLI